MILAALGPVGVVIAIFFGTLLPTRRRATTKAEREQVAGSARDVRRYVGLTMLVLLPLLVVAGVHLWDTSWMPLELS